MWRSGPTLRAGPAAASCKSVRYWRVRPSPALQGPTSVPDLGHVADLVAVEGHAIDVVRTRALAGRRRTALAGVRGDEGRVGDDVVALGIRRPALQVVMAVRHHLHQALHPVGVTLQGLHVDE